MCGQCVRDDLLDDLYTLRERIERLDTRADNLDYEELRAELTKLADEMYDL